MATSTAPTMLKFLYGLLGSSLTGVQVMYGDDARHAERRNVVLSGAVDHVQESWKNLGGQKREELYRLDGFVQSRQPGSTTQDATEDAWALMAVVDAQLRTLISGPGLAAVSAALDAAFPDTTAQMTLLDFKPKSGRPFPLGNDGIAYQIDFVVEITARI